MPAVAAGGVGPPPLVTTVTVIVWAWSPLTVTVKVAGVVPEFPSTTETSAASIVTTSSSVIVASPRLSVIVGPVLFESTTANVSFGSSRTSPTTGYGHGLGGRSRGEGHGARGGEVVDALGRGVDGRRPPSPSRP